jgi:hypothetical protein
MVACGHLVAGSGGGHAVLTSVDLVRLRMLEYLPGQMAAAEARLRQRAAAGSTAPCGAWQSLVGRLNRQFVLDAHAPAEMDSECADAQDLQPTADLVQWLKPVKPTSLPPSCDGLYELRLYTLIPGGLARYVPLLLDVLPARERYSPNVGIWTSETGGANQLIHMWVYRDAQERAELRISIDSDPAWNRFVPQILPLILTMESYFLVRIL